eukprot:TRINITY_DN9167_c0_g1_i2.p1 TRINITY_DN9167_c0_g1~~TRINITY_DN9167_c0_g1_i2.p1  ORF type:complete len:422 (+),score=161.85 TRINITY_DN9167_c0_g1_i2:55-1320(+)
MTATFSAALLEEKLKGLGRAVRSIRATALWLSFYPQDAKEIVGVWRTAFLRHSADYLTALGGDAAAAPPGELQSSSSTSCRPTYNKCNLMFVAHEVLLLTRRNPGSFAMHFSSVLPEVLTHCPPDDEVLYNELSRLVSIWTELRIFKPEVLAKLQEVTSVPAWGAARCSTSRFPDLVIISDAIAEAEQARRAAAAATRKRKWCAVDETPKRIEEELRCLEATAEAVRKLQRTVRDVKTRLTDDVVQADRAAITTIKTKVNELQAKAGPAPGEAPSQSPTPVPDREPSAGGDEPMQEESPSRVEAPKEQERVFEKGQRVLYRGRDGQFGGKVVYVDKSIVPYSYQVLLDNGIERFTEASHMFPEGSVEAFVDLEDLFSRFTPPATDIAEKEDDEPDVTWADLLRPAVDAVLDTFSESAASEA